MKFIVDTNVGKLTKWLRMVGYDTRFFDGEDDAEIVYQALTENRILLTRDTHLMDWGVIRSGHIHALLVKNDDPNLQILQVIHDLKLEVSSNPFTLCLECNQPLKEIERSKIKDRVPLYVFLTQDEFKQCLTCCRVYWRGTHWYAMVKKLEAISRSQQI